LFCNLFQKIVEIKCLFSAIPPPGSVASIVTKPYDQVACVDPFDVVIGDRSLTTNAVSALRNAEVTFVVRLSSVVRNIVTQIDFGDNVHIENVSLSRLIADDDDTGDYRYSGKVSHRFRCSGFYQVTMMVSATCVFVNRASLCCRTVKTKINDSAFLDCTTILKNIYT
jgi:hypothetical protein